MNFAPMPLDGTPFEAIKSFHYTLAMLTPAHHNNKNYRMTDSEWWYLEDSHRLFAMSWGYYGIAYIHSKESKILISHEGTFLHGISDLFDILADILYMIGIPPVTHIAMSMCFTNELKTKFPNHKIEHTGLSLGGIIAQYELFFGESALAIESPGIENYKFISGLYATIIDKACNFLATHKLSSFAPLIPAIHYGAIGRLLYSNPLLYGSSYLLSHYFSEIVKNKLGFEAYDFDYDPCNLAVARGEWHLITSWSKITEYGTTYILASDYPPQEPIIQWIMKFDSRTYIHDPFTLYDAIVKETDINSDCVDHILTTECICTDATEVTSDVIMG